MQWSRVDFRRRAQTALPLLLLLLPLVRLLAVLAVLGRRHRHRRRRDTAAALPDAALCGLKADATESVAGSEPSRRVQSVISQPAQAHEAAQAQAQELVDPVLLADGEELVQKLGSLVIPRGHGRPGQQGDARLPLCFQTRKYGRKRKQLLEKAAKVEREATDDRGKKKTKREPPAAQVSQPDVSGAALPLLSPCRRAVSDECFTF